VNPKKVIISTLLAGILVGAVVWLRHELAIDSCLDRGGRRDYSGNVKRSFHTASADCRRFSSADLVSTGQQRR